MNRRLKPGLLIVIMLLLQTCKKPTENIKLIIDTDILKYTALIYVTDGTDGGPAPSDVAIKITGTSSEDIYELSGKKDIMLSAGTVTIGLAPDIVPTEDSPVKANVEISAAGYRKEIREIVFTGVQKQQTIHIPISKTGSTVPPVIAPPPTVYDQIISLNFTGRCPARQDLEIRPSVYLFFREHNIGGSFQYLGYLDKGRISTKYLLMGKTYDFQVVFGGEAYQVSQQIEQLSYELTMDMPAACNL